MANETRFSQLADLVLSARALPANERDAFLKSVCGDDDDLHMAALRLAQIPTDAADRLELYSPLGPSPERPQFAPGSIFGKYRIVEKIAEGGMSTVYRAVHVRSHHTVALKFLNPSGLRFSTREHEILGELSHDTIARLFDSDITEEGVPYLVLEYVEGVSLTTYCETHALSLERRLELFLAICKGIQYAHSVPIVHRDIKPENVLVTKEETPKIVDFGIARTLPPDMKAATITHGQLQPMTLAFASPEQVLGHRVGIPSDIYSLGVLLCVLLTGRLPYQIRTSGDLYTAIPTQEPIRPSELVEAPRIENPSGELHYPYMGPAPPRDEPRRLRRRLEGDLNAIVLKALRKESERRYQTVLELAADIQHFLDGEPVAAQKGTRRYFAWKFIQRRKWGVAALSTIFLLLLTATILLTIERNRTLRQERRAVLLNSFLLDIFSRLDPVTSRGETISTRDLLTYAAQTLRVRRDLTPPDRVRLACALGDVYLTLGMYPEATALLRLSLKEIETVSGPEPDTAHHCLLNLAESSLYESNFQAADQFARQAEALAPSTAQQDLRLSQTLQTRAVISWSRGDFASADSLYARALRLNSRLGPEHQEQVASTLSALGVLLSDLAKYQRADELFRKSLEIRRRILPTAHPDTAKTLFDRGNMLHRQGKYSEAQAAYIEALEMYRKIFGDEHPQVGRIMSAIGALQHAEAHLSEAEATLRQALPIVKRTRGEKSESAASVMNNLAALLRDEGRYDEAEKLYHEILAIDEQTLGAHPTTANTLGNLGALYNDTGRYHEALAVNERALAMLKATFSKAHPSIALSLTKIAFSYKALGQLDRAEAANKEALAIYRRTLGPSHLEVLVAENNLASLLRDLGKLDEAKELLEGTLTRALDALGPDHQHVATFRMNLARINNLQANYAEGLQQAEQARLSLAAALPDDHVLIAKADGTQGESLVGLREFARAERLLLRSFSRIKEVEGEGSPNTHLALNRIVHLYSAWGRPVKAAKFRSLIGKGGNKTR